MSETPSSYFEDLWGASPDPWDHAARWYEQRKYDLTAAVLPHARYRRAVEPACGVGLLTRRLAGRADAVVASDRYERAAAEAAARCADLANVCVGVADVRDGPASSADLIVLGEVLYYFAADTVAELVQRWSEACEPGGHLVLVHYRPRPADHVLTGDAVHTIARDVLGPPAVTVADPSFHLDVFARP